MSKDTRTKKLAMLRRLADCLRKVSAQHLCRVYILTQVASCKILATSNKVIKKIQDANA